jgi:hypothetical protein
MQGSRGHYGKAALALGVDILSFAGGYGAGRLVGSWLGGMGLKAGSASLGTRLIVGTSTGIAGGGVSGFATGTGQSLVNGLGFGDSLKMGGIVSAYGAAFGGAGGGLVGAPSSGSILNRGVSSFLTRAIISTGPIQPGEVTTFQDFVDRSVVGDNLEGHELWQHANLKSLGLASERLSTPASQNNPVLALDRTVHLRVNAAQRVLNAAGQTPIENINANAAILRNLNVAPESTIMRLQRMAIQHARSLGY